MILCAVASRIFAAESDVLDTFWTAQADHTIDRRDLLKYFLAVEIQRPPTWDRDAVRRESEQVNARLAAAGCFVCRSRDGRPYWHHVIRVEHGGSASARNRVRLCFPCHRDLHPHIVPWPGDRTRHDQTPWTRLTDIIDEVLRGEFTVEAPRRQVHDDEGHD